MTAASNAAAFVNVIVPILFHDRDTVVRRFDEVDAAHGAAGGTVPVLKGGAWLVHLGSGWLPAR
jgi:hypothetical protein